MAGRKIDKISMEQLRGVLRGKDRAAMWKELNRLGLSPQDKVGEHITANRIRSSATPRSAGGIVACSGVHGYNASKNKTGRI